MALSKLSGDEHAILFIQLCNVLDPGIAVALSSVSNELRAATQALLPQLKTGHEAAAALCRKLGHRNCKALREAKTVQWVGKGLTADELKLLGTLGSVLPALEELTLWEPAAGPDGVRRLAAGLGAGALPAVTWLGFFDMHVGDAGASALAAALGQGALPRLKTLYLYKAAIGDVGLVALAPALRRRPALEWLSLTGSPFGDEGLAALVAAAHLPAAAAPRGRRGPHRRTGCHRERGSPVRGAGARPARGHQSRVADGGAAQSEALEPRQGALSQGGGEGRGACVAHMHIDDPEVDHGRQRARAQPRRQPLHALGAGCWHIEVQLLERRQH